MVPASIRSTRCPRTSRRGRLVTALAAAWLLFGFLAAPALAAGASEKRIALVVGNAAYASAPLATAANDAGLIAQTLQAAGFDVVGARDLDEDSLRRALRDFVDKAQASGPDTVAFVYLSGYGLQLEGENYFAPVDARIESASDVAAAALRLSDYTKRLAALPLKARFLVLDAARSTPFARSGEPLAGGLALTEADPGSLIAFNAAPGTVGPAGTGSYGAYAEALVEMIREGGLPPAELFDRVRLRVSERTRGAEVPWDSARIEAPFVFFERAAGAPAAGRPAEVAALRDRPIREIGARDAYALCLERDSVEGYQEFLAAYPGDPMGKRVRALLAARREALTWRRTLAAGSPDAFWSYLSRYPRGPHAADARRRLGRLAAALEPPPSYTPIAYDVPPPPVEEVVYVERPVLVLDDPIYAFAPPPPPPAMFLPPPPAYIVELAPPPPPSAYYALPVPAFVPVPTYVVAPAYVAAPPDNVIYEHIHNTTVINEINAAALRPAGAIPPGAAIGAGAVVGAAAGLAAARVALPPAVAQKAALQPGGPGQGQFGPGLGRPGSPAGQPGLFGKTPQPGQAPPAAGLPGQIPPAGLGKAPGPLPGQVPGAPAQAAQPGQIPGKALPGFGAQPLPQQAARPGAPAAVTAPGQAPPGQTSGQAPGQVPGRAAIGQPLPGQGKPGLPGAPAQGVPGKISGQNPGQNPGLAVPGAAARAPQPGLDARQAAQQRRQDQAIARQQMMQQRQQARAQTQIQAQAQRGAIRGEQSLQRQQALAVQRPEGMQQRQMQLQQNARQQQMLMQQRQAQQAQMAARQQQMQAGRQQQQMQMMQQRQMQMQQARQQQMMQQRQMQPPPQRQPPPQQQRGGGGHCPPGQLCR